MSLGLDKYLLIDGDIIVYRAGFAVEDSIFNCINKLTGKTIKQFSERKSANEYLKNDINLELNVTKEYPDISEARTCTEFMINRILGELAGYIPKIYLTGKGNFRYNIAKTRPYKGNRKSSSKPYYYDQIRDHLVNKYGAIVTKFNMEADDYLAIHGTRLGGSKSIICSTDKDLKQVPGWHYNFVKGDLIRVSEEEGYRNLFKQFIIGDSVDNIPGIPHCGKRLAKKLDEIDDILGMYSYVVKCYHDRKLNVDYFNEQGGLLYLLRHKNDSWIKRSERLSKGILE